MHIWPLISPSLWANRAQTAKHSTKERDRETRADRKDFYPKGKEVFFFARNPFLCCHFYGKWACAQEEEDSFFAFSFGGLVVAICCSCRCSCRTTCTTCTVLHCMSSFTLHTSTSTEHFVLLSFCHKDLKWNNSAFSFLSSPPPPAQKKKLRKKLLWPEEEEKGMVGPPPFLILPWGG